MSTVKTLESSVQQVFVETTRYPIEILDPTAHLEDDLGIDSVKRAEILLALQKKFDLPSELNVPAEKLNNIRNIAEAISSFVQKDGVDATPSYVSDNEGESSVRQGTDSLSLDDAQLRGETDRHQQENIEKTVRSVFAEVTRYPIEILDPTAHLEDDLGIDSVKRAEILLALQKKFDLPSELNVPAEKINNIRNIAEEIISFVQKNPDVEKPLSVETVSVRENHDTHSFATTSILDNGKEFITNSGRLIPEGHKPFAGKVALVTGSGHGIGKTIACRIAKLGASVVVNSFHSRVRGDEVVQEIKKEGGKAIHIWGSVANQTHLNQMFDEIDDRFGQLDFFVSNASNGIICPLKDVSEEQWKRAFHTNVIGLHQGAMRAADVMKRSGGGKIITLSSPGAHRYIQHFGCMGAIKAAVESLTLYLSVEFASDNIQVNCVSAGPIYGELLSKYPDSDLLIPYWESLSAGNRLGEEDDVADFVTYLLSGDSNKITGSVLLLDAGGSKRI